MPAPSTVCLWLTQHPDFAEQYARARVAQTEALLEEIFEIADDGSRDSFTDSDGYERVNHDHINRSRLRVDARKWAMSKLAPKKYGDKLELAGDPDNPIRHEVTRIERVIIDPADRDGEGV